MKDNEVLNLKMDLALSRTLLFGVLASTAIIVFGLLLMVFSSSTGYVCDSAGDALACILNFNPLSGAAQIYPTSLTEIVSGVISLKPFAIISLGLIVLLATPVLRVLASLVLFAAQKNRAFVLITLFVLLVLLFSFFVVPQIPIFRA